MTATRRPTGDVAALVRSYCEGRGLTAAAEAAGMSRATAWRTLQREDVAEMVAEVDRERRASVIEWARTIRGLADLISDEVVQLLDDDPTPATVCRLASVLIPEVRHLVETVDLVERLEQLEERMTGDDSAGRALARVVEL